MESLTEDVAAAVDLREGPEGVRSIIEAVPSGGGIPLKELARSVRLPLPVVAAVRRELEKRNVFIRSGGVALSEYGRELLQSSGGATDVDFRCEACGGSGSSIPDNLRGLLDTVEKAFGDMPRVDVSLDQAFATAETSLKRAMLALERGTLAGRCVAFLGDDDLVSFSAALLLRELGADGSTELVVFEIDKRITAYIHALADAHGLGVRCVEHDLRHPFPIEFKESFHCFFADPPYTLPGLKLFLSRGAELLRRKSGLHAFLSFAHKDPEFTVEMFALIAETGFAVAEVAPGFNMYRGADIIGNTGQMIHLKSSAVTTSLLDTGKYSLPIYTGELKVTVRNYVCAACGEKTEVGRGAALHTIEELKEAGCPVCGGKKFRFKGRKKAVAGASAAEKSCIRSSVDTYRKVFFEGIELNRLHPEDAAELKRGFAGAGARAWCCFVPFLHFTSEAARRQIYWKRGADGPIILYRKEKSSIKWELYTLAASTRAGALEAVELMDRLNGNRLGRILWAGALQAELLKGDRSFSVEYRDSEYLYDAARVAALKGPEFADVRKKLNRFARENPGVEFVEMKPEDIPECLRLLEAWDAAYRERNIEAPLLDHDYTKNALARFDDFAAPDFMGWTLKAAGRIAAFALAGEMTPQLANFFALKTDLDIRGCSAYMRWRVIGFLAGLGYSRVNDASDLNLPGLKRHKSKFRPVEKLDIYKILRRRD